MPRVAKPQAPAHDLTVHEVAAEFRVGNPTVLAMIARGELKAYRVGNRYRIPATEIDRIRRGAA